MDTSVFKQSTFIGNIRKEYAKFIRQAAENTGFPVQVAELATDRFGCELPGYVGVVTTAIYRDHEEFWQEYYRLRDEAKG